MQIFEPLAIEPISPKEFAEQIDTVLAKEADAELVSLCASLLARLNADTKLLLRLFDESQSPEEWLKRFSPPQSLMLFRGRGWSVRANIWVPTQKAAAFQGWEADLYAYGLAHNHDFEFITVGHIGPGYTTDIFNVDVSSAYAGSQNRILSEQPLRVQLEPGTVIHFNPFSDAHIQHEPPAISVSLNLVFQRAHTGRDQLFFDISSGTIAPPHRAGSAKRRITALHLLEALGGDDAESLLDNVARTAVFADFRQEAIEAQGRLRDAFA